MQTSFQATYRDSMQISFRKRNYLRGTPSQQLKLLREAFLSMFQVEGNPISKKKFSTLLLSLVENSCTVEINLVKTNRSRPGCLFQIESAKL